MRFEIGPGGGFVILVGLAGLSAAVFVLGMISGREMAETELSQSQLATVYPMPQAAGATPSPAAVDSGAATQQPARVAAAEVPPPPPPHPAAVSPTARSAAPLSPPAPGHAAAQPAVAAATPPHSPPPPAANQPSEEEGGEEASAPPAEAGAGGEGEGSPRPYRAHRHGYNIVIDAAMDRAGADRMASRLLALGYTPHLVETEISGQIWYKLQIGPYSSEDDARAAQDQLRDAYTARYIQHLPARPAADPAAAGANSDAVSPNSKPSGDDTDDPD